MDVQNIVVGIIKSLTDEGLISEMHIKKVCILNKLILFIMKYLNLKTVYGVETIDELNPKDFATFKEFRIELRRLINEYHLAGMNVYSSQRCSKDWNK